MRLSLVIPTIVLVQLSLLQANGSAEHAKSSNLNYSLSDRCRYALDCTGASITPVDALHEAHQERHAERNRASGLREIPVVRRLVQIGAEFIAAPVGAECPHSIWVANGWTSAGRLSIDSLHHTWVQRSERFCLST